jgi:hypothetical protein
MAARTASASRVRLLRAKEHDPLRSPADRKPLARYGAMEGALARGFFHLDHVEPGCLLRNIGRPLFPKSHLPVFSLLLLLEKSSKSLIPLSDCPFVLNRLPVFLENLPVSGKKQRWNELE